MSGDRRVVVTGGPGAGKTTLIAALATHGYTHVPETARALIQDRKRRGMSPRPALAEFATEILRLDIERYRSTRADSNPVFFDRGIIDALGMLDQLGLLTESETRQYLLDYPYSRRVFVLPPWEQIYTGDSERDQTFADSVRVHDDVCKWYVQCGYQPIEVPRAPVEERCAFVLRSLGV